MSPATVRAQAGRDRAKAGRPPRLQGRARPESTSSLSIPSRMLASILPALTKQLKQQHEEIYEIEIKRQRTEHRLLAGDFTRIRLQIHLLDALRVVCGKAHEYDDADDGDCELKGARPDKNIDERSDH